PGTRLPTSRIPHPEAYRMPDSLTFLDWHVAGNRLEAWILAIAGFLLAFIVVLALRGLVTAGVAKRREGPATHVPDILLELLRETRFFFATIVGLFVATRLLTLPTRLEQATGYVLALLLLLQVGLWGNALLNL